MKIIEMFRGMFGRARPPGPVPLKYEPEFHCWSCLETLPAAGRPCPVCGEPPPKIDGISP